MYQIGGSADGNAALAGGMNEMPPQLKAQFVLWATAEGHRSAFQGGVWTEELLERWLDGSGFPETINEVKAQEVHSDWWEPIEVRNKLGRCYYPSVLWAGWYDIFLDGSTFCARAAGGGGGGEGSPHTQTHMHSARTLTDCDSPVGRGSCALPAWAVYVPYLPSFWK